MSSFVSQSSASEEEKLETLLLLIYSAPLWLFFHRKKKASSSKRLTVQREGRQQSRCFWGEQLRTQWGERGQSVNRTPSITSPALPPLHPSLLAQPFLGGQAVLPQSHAGATIASPQLQPFHCVMNTSRNKPKNRPIGPAEPPPTPPPPSPSPVPPPLRTAVFVCAHRTVARSPGLRTSCGDAVVAPSHRRPVSERGGRRPPSARRQPRSGQVRSRRRGGGKGEGGMSPEE